MGSTSTQAPIAHDVVVVSTGGDALLALPVDDGVGELSRVIVLRDSGRRTFEAWARGASRDDLVDDLVDAGAPSRSQAEADADDFLDELRRHGIESAPTKLGAALDLAPRDSGGELEGEDLERLAREVLESGFRFRFRAGGRSMRPLVPDGSRLDVEPRPFASVRIGEVALYSAGERRLVAHRVVGRRGKTLLARGDSCARLDEVLEESYLGVVAARERAGSGWQPVSSGWRRVVGLATGHGYRVVVAVVRTVIVGPLRRSYAAESLLRKALRAVLRAASGLLRRFEGSSARVRRPLDRWRAALLSTAEKDADRRRLYERRSVQGFTSLDENVSAGLTLVEEVLLERSAIEPGRALVLGCGPGRECLALASRGFDVTGLDREPGLLERARELAQDRGVDLRLVAGEAHHFRVEGEPFDVVVIFSGLYNMVLPRVRRVEMLAAAREHLRPGGRVLVTFLSAYVEPGTSPRRARDPFLEALNPAHEGGDTYLLNEAVHVFASGDEVGDEARAAGLEVDDVHRDQRAYDRAQGRVKGWAVLRRPS